MLPLRYHMARLVISRGETAVAAWIVDNMLWVGAGGVAVMVGAKVAVARIFSRLAASSEGEG